MCALSQIDNICYYVIVHSAQQVLIRLNAGLLYLPVLVFGATTFSEVKYPNIFIPEHFLKKMIYLKCNVAFKLTFNLFLIIEKIYIYIFDH